MSFPQNYQYKILDRVYYANFDEIAEKIKKGTVLRHDLVSFSKGVWLEAEKVPELAELFEEAEKRRKVLEGIDFKNILTNFQVAEIDHRALSELERTDGKVCSIHPETRPFYICIVCETLFCKDCPSMDAENRKICPFCGGSCVLYMGQMWKMEEKKPETKYNLHLTEEKIEQPQNYEVVHTKLRMKDFLNALIQPFRFPLSLLVGGILFSVLVFGQIVTLFQGGWMLLATLAITAVIMMLQFGVLSKSFENFAQNDYKRRSYIPHLRKFAIWEDFVSPFFIGTTSYLISFALFIALAAVAGSYAWFSFSADVERMEAEMLQTGQHVNSVINSGKTDRELEKRNENELRTMINKTRLKQMESVFGTNQLVDNKELAKLVKSVTRLTLWFQMPICFAFLLGALFFPAICLSTGEEHFQSMKNRFFSGFKMMRTIGFDYVKILFMCIVLLMFSGAAIYCLSWFFSKLEMPVAGIFAAIVTGSFFIFYFWTAFSSILSITLFNKETVFEQSSEGSINYSESPTAREIGEEIWF